MASYRIPDDLTAMVAEQRVIPFLGAGFSASHGLPGWTELLEQVVKDLRLGQTDPPLTFSEIEERCRGDFLQIAEYLYLRAGKSIGPLRYSISRALQPTIPYELSTPHVELVNLGAPHIYTTNFDDLIEETYRRLGRPVEVIVLPRDVATADPKETQVVKYHGDLRHDETLVLTESTYYRRLEFSSPMDVKFRSDLLGRSVLFIGYSFRDINIRVIWFRLMEMMKDVPEPERPPSYIVTLQPNPVLEALYEAVGLKAIVLDPDGEASTPEAQHRLLARFLGDLAGRASPGGLIPGTRDQMFASDGLLRRIEERFGGRRRIALGGTEPLTLLSRRRVLPVFFDRLEQIMLNVARNQDSLPNVPMQRLVLWYSQTHPPTPGLTMLAATILMRSIPRERLLEADVNWEKVWAAKLAPTDADILLRRVRSEVLGHESGEFTDPDVAYAIDVCTRIANGALVRDDDEGASQAVKDAGNELLERASALYSAVSSYEPAAGKPSPASIVDEINDRHTGGEPPDDVDWDLVPMEADEAEVTLEDEPVTGEPQADATGDVARGNGSGLASPQSPETPPS